MSYTPTNWEESATSLGPTNLNHIEQGIKEAHDKLKPTALAELLLDIFHPVGMYFETKDSTFNPNTAWGGTWVLETEGLVHVSAGATYTVSDNAQDGGEATHTLTVDEMPSHTHIQNSHQHSLGNHSHSVQRALGVSGSASWTGEQGGDMTGSAHKYAYTSVSGTTIQTITSTGQNNGNTGGQTATNQNTGGGQAHNNMQPYKNVYRWLRTA